MPRLSVWFVRASLLYLLMGCVLGALMLSEEGIALYAPIWLVLPIHEEFLLVGWLIQLAMGVAYWILPRFGIGAPRGRDGLIWTAFILTNVGILLVALQAWLPFAWVAGRALELLGVILFVSGMWRRVKPSPGAAVKPAELRRVDP